MAVTCGARTVCGTGGVGVNGAGGRELLRVIYCAGSIVGTEGRSAMVPKYNRVLVLILCRAFFHLAFFFYMSFKARVMCS